MIALIIFFYGAGLHTRTHTRTHTRMDSASFKDLEKQLTEIIEFRVSVLKEGEKNIYDVPDLTWMLASQRKALREASSIARAYKDRVEHATEEEKEEKKVMAFSRAEYDLRCLQESLNKNISQVIDKHDKEERDTEFMTMCEEYYQVIENYPALLGERDSVKEELGEIYKVLADIPLGTPAEQEYIVLREHELKRLDEKVEKLATEMLSVVERVENAYNKCPTGGRYVVEGDQYKAAKNVLGCVADHVSYAQQYVNAIHTSAHVGEVAHFEHLMSYCDKVFPECLKFYYNTVGFTTD